jgi:site-specific recombinase XerD
MAQMTALRRRMIDDMTVRNLSPATQQSYVYAVAKFSRFFGCSPDRLGIEEVRAYQLHLAGLGWSWSHINQVSCALRFFFGVTLGRPEAFDRIISAKEPKKLPVVLSGEEIVRFLQAVPGLRNRAALTTAYGAGLRVCEVAALKVGDIDSSRMVIRVEHGKSLPPRRRGAARTATSCCRPNCCASFAPTGDWPSRLPGCSPAVGGTGRSAPRRCRRPAGWPHARRIWASR